jgi:hypothetical protein
MDISRIKKQLEAMKAIVEALEILGNDEESLGTVIQWAMTTFAAKSSRQHVPATLERSDHNHPIYDHKKFFEEQGNKIPAVPNSMQITAYGAAPFFTDINQQTLADSKITLK